MCDSNTSESMITVIGLREFFHDSVQQALAHQHVVIEAQTECYVVDVLARFADVQQLHDPADHGRTARPLALMLADALSATDLEQRRHLLQRLGDVSLFMAGFFAQSFARRLVDVDYNIALGGGAYASLADSWRGQQRSAVFAGIFAELAAKFQRLVDVLQEVADMARPSTDRDVLRLYEMWLKTGSERARQQLTQCGVMPVAVIAKA